MEAFPVYLPSNASPLIYPENTAADYHTRLDQPIRLEGDWEVGLQSINYASKIDYSKEKADIHLKYEAQKLVNDDEGSFHFRLTPDKKWKGVYDTSPIKFESNGSQVNKVIEALNSLNEVILKDGEVKRLGKLFEFFRNDKGDVAYRSSLDTFSLELTGTMSYCLGFSYLNSFLGKGVLNAIDIRRVPKRPLTNKDYQVRFFNPPHVRPLKRLFFKHDKEKLPKTSIASIKKLWSERITKYENITIKFSKSNKLIVTNRNSKTTVFFSRAFQTSFHHYRPLIGKSTRWASYLIGMDGTFPEESLYLDIYSDELDMSPTSMVTDLHLELFPWNYDTNDALISYLNTVVTKRLKSELKEDYDAVKHYFHLNVSYDFQIMFLIGLHLKVYFGKDLSHLLGLQNEFLPTPHDLQLRRYYDEDKNNISILGFRSMINIEKRHRQLFLLCSLIKPTAYGVSHLPILRDFVHENVSGLSINEKRFDPIIYLPLRSNFIDSINIQLTDTEYNPVEIDDCKTIITLFFRKVKEDSKTVSIH